MLGSFNGVCGDMLCYDSVACVMVEVGGRLLQALCGLLPCKRRMQVCTQRGPRDVLPLLDV